MKKITAGIIGNQGKYGKFLSGMFNDFGCEVIGSDLRENSDEGNKNVVERSDIVIFSVPLRATVEVISSVIDFSRSEQLWMDVASLKTAPVKEMLKSKAEVVGLHPMCSPSVSSMKGQTLIACPARIENWSAWFKDFTNWTGAKIKICEPEIHDRNMAVVQGMIHAVQLSMAATIKSLGRDVEESLEFASPVYKVSLSLIGRILKQDPSLYADIQMLNENVPDVLREISSQINHLQDMVSKKDRVSFLEWFKSSLEHFDEGVLNKSNKLFEEISTRTNDF